MLERIRTVYLDYPGRFWVLMGAHFIDHLGSTILFPFFSLYITQKFGVGMTEAGILLGLWAVAGMISSVLGGALTDRFGRRGVMIFGLVISALSNLSLGFVSDLRMFYVLAVVVGLLSGIGWPAAQAMVADLLPENKRADGFGMMRVTNNLAWIIGPSIGGFLASRSYLSLFVLDAALSLLTALIVFRSIPETLTAAAVDPHTGAAEERPSILDTLRGYGLVGRDRIFLAFMVVSMLMMLAYQQMYNTLSVYLRDVHGIPPQGYGLLMSLNAATVVLVQLPLTRAIKNRPPLLMMAVGAALYMVGFTMYGLVSVYALFVAAMLVITFGEMVVVPVGQSLVAGLSPADMRGRYMAAYGLSWSIPSTVGPAAAGLILDNLNPNLLWYIAGMILAVSALGFLGLHRSVGSRVGQPLAQTGD